MGKHYSCGNSFMELINTFHLDPDKANIIFDMLLKEGYSERGICYGASRAENKILKFVGDSRIYSILANEVRKYALKSGDPRWDSKKRK